MSCPHGNPIGGCDTCDEVDAAFEAGKRSALAEQPAQQEPVSKEAIRYITATLAAFGPDEAISMTKETWAKLRGAIKTLAEQPAQHEPVAWLDPWTRNNVTTDYDAYGKHGIPLYTSPPASKPLTDEQIKTRTDEQTPCLRGQHHQSH